MFEPPVHCADCGKLLTVVFIVLLCNECLEKAIKTRKEETKITRPLEPLQA
jgi:hypothetical protein